MVVKIENVTPDQYMHLSSIIRVLNASNGEHIDATDEAQMTEKEKEIICHWERVSYAFTAGLSGIGNFNIYQCSDSFYEEGIVWLLSKFQRETNYADPITFTFGQLFVDDEGDKHGWGGAAIVYPDGKYEMMSSHNWLSEKLNPAPAKEWNAVEILRVNMDAECRDILFEVKCDDRRRSSDYTTYELLEAFTLYSTPAVEESWDAAKAIVELAEGGGWAEQLRKELGIVISPIIEGTTLDGLEIFLSEGYEPPTGIVYALNEFLGTIDEDPAPEPESPKGPFDDMPPLQYNVTHHENGRYSIGFTVPATHYPHLPFTFSNTIIFNSFAEALAQCKKDIDSVLERDTIVHGRSLKRILAEEDDE
jgi:hypothetical protein